MRYFDFVWPTEWIFAVVVVKADIVFVATWKREIYFVKTEFLKLFRDTDSVFWIHPRCSSSSCCDYFVCWQEQLWREGHVSSLKFIKFMGEFCCCCCCCCCCFRLLFLFLFLLLLLLCMLEKQALNGENWTETFVCNYVWRNTAPETDIVETFDSEDSCTNLGMHR